VIGVPISTDQMSGEMALYVAAQMPSGVPIATVGIDGAMNAGVLAVLIAGVADAEIQKRLWRFKDDLAEGLRL
jgi:5-(carboxyamino)imidazole ribonucleotide mutase